MDINSLKKFTERIIKIFTSETDAFSPIFDITKPIADALNAAKSIRGIERKPAIIIHGVMPRSGTVYAGELLSLHPDLYAYPNDIWEIPLLVTIGDMLKVQKNYFRRYRQNLERIGENDLISLFGSSFIGYLHSFAPKEKRILLKVPHVHYLGYFFTLFPHENLILLMRDGRDVVNSTIKTWPERNFSDVCKLWNKSMKMILNFQNHCNQNKNKWFIAKFEDCVMDPETFVKNACTHFGLDEHKYPFQRIKEMPVRGSSALRIKGQVTWEEGIDKPKNFKPVGRWKEWPQNKKKTFKKIAGQTLIEAGYSDDMKW